MIHGRVTRRIYNNYAAPRGGVCIRKDGSMLFFAPLACHDAMLFDGGHSVNPFAGGDDKRIDVEGDPVPVFIYATPNNNPQ